VSAGQGPGVPGYSLGQVAGHESVTLTIPQMPAHTHAVEATFSLNASAARGDATSPKDAVLAAPTTSIYVKNPDASTALNARAVTVNVSVGGTGGGVPVPTMMPFTAVTYCICYQGVVPPPQE
jgi:microcystin-dependent protein